MKKIISQFILRGLVVSGFGPIVLAVIYLILNSVGVVEALSTTEVAIGIISLTVLAFIVGGMNVIYSIERLPLAAAILIHGAVLYTAYLITYLANNWLKSDPTPILVFSLIFALTYAIIWIIVYLIEKQKTNRLNSLLAQKQANKDIA